MTEPTVAAAVPVAEQLPVQAAAEAGPAAADAQVHPVEAAVEAMGNHRAAETLGASPAGPAAAAPAAAGTPAAAAPAPAGRLGAWLRAVPERLKAVPGHLKAVPGHLKSLPERLKPAPEAPLADAPRPPIAPLDRATATRAPSPESLLPEVHHELAAIRSEVPALVARASEAEADRERIEQRLAAQRKLGYVDDHWDTMRLAELGRQEKAIEKDRASIDARIKRAEGDRQALMEARTGASAAAVGRAIARLRPDAAGTPVVEDIGTRSTLAARGIGLTKTDGTERVVINRGVVETERNLTTTAADLATGVTQKTDRVLKLQKGDKSWERSHGKSDGVSWLGGVVNLVSVEKDESKYVDASDPSGPPKTNVRSRVKTATTGLGGHTELEETSHLVNNVGRTTKKARGVSRKDGQISVVASSSKSSGKYDQEGRLVQGRTVNRSAQAGSSFTPDAIGHQASAAADAKKQFNKNLSATGNAGADLKYTVGVQELKLNPPIYQVVLTIVIGARVGVGGGAEHERADKSASGSITVGATASGTVTAKFAYKMDDRQKEAYLKNIGSAAGGQATGDFRELAVIKAAARGKASDALGVLNVFYATAAANPDAAKRIPDGTSYELGAEGTLGASLGVGGKTPSGFGVGVDASVSATKGIKRTVGNRSGKINITLEINSATAAKLGLSGSYSGVTVGGSDEHKTSGARSVTFVLDPGDTEHFDRRYRELIGASADNILDLMKRYQTLIGAHSISAGQERNRQASLAIGQAELKAMLGSSSSDSESVDDQGNIRRDFSGASTAGIEASLYGHKYNYGTEDRFAGTSLNGDVSADVSASATKTSFLKSLRAAPGKAIGFITGSAKAGETRTDVAGMHLTARDFAAIMVRAKNEPDWMNAVPADIPKMRFDWIAARMRIRAAGANTEQVARELRRFVAEAGPESAGVVQSAFRPIGSGGGGDRFEWPEELVQHRQSFDALVFADPLTAAQTQAAEGDAEGAIVALQRDVKVVRELSKTLADGSAYFQSKSTQAEMMALLRTRDAELSAEARILRVQNPPLPVKGQPKPVGVAKLGAPAAAVAKPRPAVALTVAQEAARELPEDDAARIRGEVAYEQLQDLFANHKVQEKRLYDEIDAQYSRKALGFIPLSADQLEVHKRVMGLQELHALWGRQIANYREIGSLFGWAENLGAGREPDLVRFKGVQERRAKR